MKLKRDYQTEYDGLARELQEAVDNDAPGRVAELNAAIRQLLEDADDAGEQVQRAAS